MSDIAGRPRILINGNFSDDKGDHTQRLSALDRGFQYGDGLFETLAVSDGVVNHWSLHWARLCEACERLFIPTPNEVQIRSEIDKVLAGVGKEIVKIIISRGEGVRGYAFRHVSPTRVVSAYPWPDLPKANATQGIALFECRTPIARQPALAGIKHLNRLENILARHEWNDARFAEGIMLDMEKNVIEGTMSNVFLVKDNILQTPDLSQCGVAGITRQRIMHVANEKGITLEVKEITLLQLERADEVFVCNTVIGIWPVNKINQIRFDVEEEQNPVTRLIQRAIA